MNKVKEVGAFSFVFLLLGVVVGLFIFTITDNIALCTTIPVAMTILNLKPLKVALENKK